MPKHEQQLPESLQKLFLQSIAPINMFPLASTLEPSKTAVSIELPSNLRASIAIIFDNWVIIFIG